MELITNILIEYLKHNKRIVVPKLGAFIVKQPSGIIRFTDLMRNDDGVLRSLLVAYGMSELEAIGKIDRFVFEIRHAISRDGKYALPNFGEFCASENNTIVFTHISIPKIIGGNIKPPVEVLNAEKLKLQLLANSMAQTAQTQKPQKPQKEKAKAVEDNTLSLSKPDAYLRGLNYDDRKKKHGEERTDRRRMRQRRFPLLPLFILIVVAGCIYGLWYWLDMKSANTQPSQIIIEEPRIIEADTTALCDSLIRVSPIDSLQPTPVMVLDSVIDTTNNSVTE